MSTEFSEPLSIRDVGLAAGQILGVPGIDQHHVQLRLHRIVERLPVTSRCLHDHQRDVFVGQVLGQSLDLGRGCSPYRDLLVVGAVSFAGYAHTDLDIAFADVHAGAPFVLDLHRGHLPFCERADARCDIAFEEMSSDGYNEEVSEVR